MANFSQDPKLGRVFTRVGAGGQPEDEYAAGSLLNMTMIDPSAANGSTTFGRAWWMLLASHRMPFNSRHEGSKCLG